MQGIIVAPGVIDADFEGEIKVMTCSPSGVSVVKAGQRLAQLILLPAVQTKSQSKKEKKKRKKREKRTDLVHLTHIGYKT